MLRISISPEKFLPLLKNAVIPALIFGAALIGCYAASPLSENTMLGFHSLFFILSLACFLVLLYFNRGRPAFFILLFQISYILINWLKRSLGSDYLLSPAYLNLSVFLPLNLLIFCFLPQRPLLKKTNVYLLLAVFAQFALAEKLSAAGIAIGFFPEAHSVAGMSLSGFLLFAIVLAAMFLRMSVAGTIDTAGLFYASFCVFLGFYYSESPTALTVFFSSAALILLLTVIQDIYHSAYKDILTDLPSRNAYMLNARDFPLKYSTGVICIDDYEKIRMVFGRLGTNALVKMIAARINETETEALIYRYAEDEFVLIFKNEDKNNGFDRLEKIRRNIASAEFMLGRRKKPVKLTVSCSVSEKKRSDANSIEVLIRARKALQKTYKFTQNVTTKA